MQCKTSEANAFQFERPLWYMQKLLAVQCSAESWMPFNMKDPFGRTGWLPAHHQRGLSKWMPFSSAHVCECPIELLPASCIPSGMPVQLAVQKSHSCFTRWSKLYNLKAYASHVNRQTDWQTHRHTDTQTLPEIRWWFSFLKTLDLCKFNHILKHYDE